MNDEPEEAEALTDEDRATVRARLAKQLEDLRGQLDLLRASSAPVSMDLSIGRLSRMDAMQQQQMASASRRRAEVEITKMHAALQRLQDSSYGECALCGGDIGRRRLLARPAAPYCRHCEEGGSQA